MPLRYHKGLCWITYIMWSVSAVHVLLYSTMNIEPGIYSTETHDHDLVICEVCLRSFCADTVTHKQIDDMITSEILQWIQTFQLHAWGSISIAFVLLPSGIYRSATLQPVRCRNELDHSRLMLIGVFPRLLRYYHLTSTLKREQSHRGAAYRLSYTIIYL